jgi:hypothetical protein
MYTHVSKCKNDKSLLLGIWFFFSIL